jgi:glycosyltransferase involved in cell wall biosynthesis
MWTNAMLRGSFMSSTISVVVPTYNSASVIQQCLESLSSQTHAPVNVVVCDGGSSDATVEISNACGATVVLAPASRSSQRNTGALNALGEYVVFVDSDMKLSRTVLEECVSSFTDSDAALVIPEVDIGQSYWARVRAFERSFYQGVWWLQAARCFRKEQFLGIGGFDVGLIGAEDWDLDERIRVHGSVREISATIEHDERRASLNELMEKKTHYSKSFRLFEERHPQRAALCFSSRKRAWLIARRPDRLARHPILALGMSYIGVLEICVSKGWLKRWSGSSQERMLDSSLNPIVIDDSE